MLGSARLLAIAFAVLVIANSAYAADTGTISGVVFDRSGQPAVDAAVKISGDHLPVGRTVRTGPNGAYQFEYLLPGEYAIEVDAPAGRARRAAVVELGRDTQVDFVIGLAVDEQVTVTAATAVVDVRSTEVSFNFAADALNLLPLERTYRGLFQLIPGVADNRSPVGPAAGGNRQDNTYLIDGANITNPGFGYLSTEVNALDIAEVNLKRAGISAEFGRTGGSVTNAISRSGSNTLAGIARTDWLPPDLVSAFRIPDELERAGIRPGAFRDLLLTTERGLAAGLGGPIVKDRAFFYGSARSFRDTKWARFNKASVRLPDEVRTGTELYGKITSTPVAAHQTAVSYRHRPNHIDNAGLSSDHAPGTATAMDNGSGIGTAEWSNFSGPRRSLNLRYLYMRENNEDLPVTDLGYLPPFNPDNLSRMGQYTDPAQANLIVGGIGYANTQNYRRHEVRGTFGQFLDIGKTSHALKAGFGYEFAEEELNRLANGWGTITNITQSGVPALRARYYTRQPPQLGYGRTSSLFVQDDVSARRLSLNLGVLLNRDEFSQNVRGSGGCPSTVALKGGAAVYESKGDTCNFLRFGLASEIQPRLGIAFQMREGKGDKAYANWGRYFNMDQKSSGRSLAPNRIFQTQTVFDPSGNVLSSGPLASTTAKMIDPAIKPIYTDEILFGYALPLAGAYSLDVFFMSREMHNFIEDVPSRMTGTAQDSGPYVAANLPCAAFEACRSANARRSYRAMTIDFRKRNGRWTGDVNYTWSRFAGNYDLDYSAVTVFNTSSFVQDGPGTYVEDTNRFGPLFEDRPHVFKAFGSYDPGSGLTLSAYLRVQSGTPWTARARDWAGAVMNYLEPAGTHRNPTWTNLDLTGGYRLPINGPAQVSVEARLANVFNSQTRLLTDSQQYLDLRTLPAPPYFAPYLQPNPLFGAGNGFAPPRRLHVGAVIRF